MGIPSIDGFTATIMDLADLGYILNLTVSTN
jgi:uncharacterized membrane protein